MNTLLLTPRKQVSRTTISAIAMSLVAMVFVVALTRSEERFRWRACTVDVRVARADPSHPKEMVARLICSDRIIRLTTGMIKAHGKFATLRQDSVVGCTFSASVNPFGLRSEQVLPDSVDCILEKETVQDIG